MTLLPTLSALQNFRNEHKISFVFCRIGNRELYAIHSAFNITNIYHLYTILYVQFRFLHCQHHQQEQSNGIFTFLLSTGSRFAVVICLEYHDNCTVEIMVHTMYRILSFHSQAVTETNILYLISAKLYKTKYGHCV